MVTMPGGEQFSAYLGPDGLTNELEQTYGMAEVSSAREAATVMTKRAGMSQPNIIPTCPPVWDHRLVNQHGRDAQSRWNANARRTRHEWERHRGRYGRDDAHDRERERDRL